MGSSLWPELRSAPWTFLPPQPTHKLFTLTPAFLSNTTALICSEAILMEVVPLARRQRLSANTAVIDHRRTVFPVERLFG
jgi:hypothetical protein